MIYLGTSKAGLFQLKGNDFVRVEQVGTKPIEELYFISDFIGYIVNFLLLKISKFGGAIFGT